MPRIGKKSRNFQLAMLAALLPASAAAAQEASSDLAKALSFKPRQADVNYEQVPESSYGECKIKQETRSEGTGFLVSGPAGQPLRWFVDTNGDKRLDRWSFYNAGVEVYRESDVDGDRVADEYRWLSTEGIRKGVDDDSDGSIDQWQVISAEEVTAEIVKATAAVSEQQFERLLITSEEIEGLGLGEQKREEIQRSVQDARSQFTAWARGQNVVTRNTRWMHFGADKPGLVPEGTDGSTQDVVVYENVVALLEENDEPRQLLVGTMVKVEDRWRLIGLPSAVSDGEELSERGRFFSATFTNRNDAAPTVTSGMTKALERLVKQLQDVDEKLLAREGDLEVLNAERADILEKMVVEAPNEQERQQWIQQMADTVNAAAQTGEYEGGVQRLIDFAQRLKAEGAADNDVAYVSYRALEAQHRVAMLDAEEGEFDKIQQRHIESLEGFVEDFADSPEAAEAMTQLALDAEFSGDSDRAKEWYTKASRSFADTAAGEKAAGALRRLSIEGKGFGFRGTTVDGRAFSSTALRGKPVVYHCWASWCGTCKADMRILKVLQSKYEAQGLQIVGVNFDNSERELADRAEFLAKGEFPWAHVAEKGGLDGKLASYYGILTLPMNVIVDSDGRVVRMGVHSSEIDSILGELLNEK